MAVFVNAFVAAAAGSKGGGSSGLPGSLALPPVVVWGNLLVYLVAWALLMWPEHLPLGRPCIAVVFAALACGLRALCSAVWPQEGYPTVDVFGKVDVTPIALLFGLMLVNEYLKDTGLWHRVERLLDGASPTSVLIKVCACSALMSAFLLNDTTCFVLTPTVLGLCARRGARSALPYLLAVSTSSNIGSSLTTIGNPQNALIASICPGISFLGFSRAMIAPVSAGLLLNTAALWLWFRKDLVFETEGSPQEGLAPLGTPVQLEEGCGNPSPTARHLYAATVAAIVMAMLAGWFLGLATDDVALATGAALMLARSVRRRLAGETGAGVATETDFALGAVDYSILILFFGQFVLAGATVDTGLPQMAFQHVLGPCSGDLAASPWCVLYFAGVVLVLSNLISNVPVILMLEPLLKNQPAENVTPLWVLCAWVATVAGNFTMLGSAANLIVAHKAESQGERSYTATNLGKASMLPTLVVASVGVFLMPPLGQAWSWLIPVVLVAAVGTVCAAGAALRRVWSRAHCCRAAA